MVRTIGWIVGGFVALLLALSGLQYAASERVEVVELHTISEAGEEVVTRLWLVDYEGMQYLRVGGDGSGWYSRTLANPEISLTRDAETRRYIAVPRPELSLAINDLMQEKYTWGDSVIGAMFGRDGSIPIELQPVPQ